MHQRQLGPFEVSAIGLGCMNVAMGYDPADPAEAERLIGASIDSGYTFLDTASMYGWGVSEQMIGRILKHRRDEYVLASKCGFAKGNDNSTLFDGSPEAIHRTCEESLRNLQTEVIDLYYLHRIDPQVPIEDSIGALADLVHDGKIRTIGLSEVSTESLHRAHAVFPITALQSEYSLWSRTPERKILQACEELDVAFVPFSPLARSFLTGITPPLDKLREEDIRATIARPRFEGDNFAQNRKLLAPYKEIADEVGCSMAQLALAWVLARQNRKMIPIPGTKDFAHMQENAAAGDIKLDAATVERLDALINENTVAGERYTDAGMKAADSEKD
ncbi:MAG: aldo/keto reductase [Pseudomonadota bacterium]